MAYRSFGGSGRLSPASIRRLSQAVVTQIPSYLLASALSLAGQVERVVQASGPKVDHQVSAELPKQSSLLLRKAAVDDTMT
jgi:hypothetical protein